MCLIGEKNEPLLRFKHSLTTNEPTRSCSRSFDAKRLIGQAIAGTAMQIAQPLTGSLSNSQQPHFWPSTRVNETRGVSHMTSLSESAITV